MFSPGMESSIANTTKIVASRQPAKSQYSKNKRNTIFFTRYCFLNILMPVKKIVPASAGIIKFTIQINAAEKTIPAVLALNIPNNCRSPRPVPPTLQYWVLPESLQAIRITH